MWNDSATLSSKCKALSVTAIKFNDLTYLPPTVIEILFLNPDELSL